MKGSVESWLGRNVVGIVAAALVFAGLVFLGAALAPELSDGAKAAFMFALSGTLAVAGFFATRKRRNGFTVALLGCGISSLFISILVTHLLFRMIGVELAYTLLLAWMAACLAVSAALRSAPLVIVAQLGFTASLVLGYGDGADGTRLALLVGYQLAASFVLVGGSVMAMRGMYRESLILTLALNVLSGALICQANGLADAGQQASSWAAIALVVQCVQATALAGLLCLSVTRVPQPEVPGCGDNHECDGAPIARPFRPSSALSSTASAWLVVSAASLWMASLRIDLVSALQLCTMGTLGFGSADSAVIDISIGVPTLLIAAAAIGVAFAMRSRGTQLQGATTRALVITLIAGGVCASVARFGLVWLGQLFAGIDYPIVGWLWIWMLVALAVGRVTGDKLYNYLSFSLLPCASFGLCMVTMPWCMVLFGGLAGFAGCLICVAFICVSAVLLVHALLKGGAHGLGSTYDADAVVLSMLSVACVEVVILLIPTISDYAYAGAFVCPIAVCILAALRYFLPWPIRSMYRNLLFAHEIAVMLLCVPLMAVSPEDAVGTALFGIGVAASVGLLAQRFTVDTGAAGETTAASPFTDGLAVAAARYSRARSVRFVVGGATFMVLVLAYAVECTPVADGGFSASVIGMACALVCIFAGFYKNVRGLHLLGLVVALGFVAKLVLVDAGSFDSLVRVAAFIGGGIVCFGISAIYNSALHRRDTLD